MILAADIGNTTVGIGLIENGQVIMSEKTMTDISEIEINYREKITHMLQSRHIDKIDGAVISSVVPLLTGIIKGVIVSEYGVEPLIVSSETAAGITITADQPEKVGSDRIADACGAVAEYGAPLIIIDMGTATTVSVINRQSEFVGGMIMPGVRTALNSLITNTAQLPQISLSSPPESIIGKNTAESIESGIIYGTASCIDGICQRLSEELGFEPKIIATGGNAGRIIPYCRHEITLDKRLLFKGLNIIYKKYGENKNA